MITLSQQEWIELTRQAKEVERLELLWKRKYRDIAKEFTDDIADNLLVTSRLNFEKVDFLPFALEHLFEVSKKAIKGANRLAAYPKGPKAPRSIDDLKKRWEKWRKNPPARQRKIAKKLKDDYVKKIQSVWEKYSRDFREGKEHTQQQVVDAFNRDPETADGRANTIVATETTRAYNQARRAFYDEADSVTHYLFLAIRDKRTTRWCSTRTGLVYAKTDPLLDKETPPIHWNCRSEIVPLSPNNATHKAMIDDPSLRRRNHSCEPLPNGWKNPL